MLDELQFSTGLRRLNIWNGDQKKESTIPNVYVWLARVVDKKFPIKIWTSKYSIRELNLYKWRIRSHFESVSSAMHDDDVLMI